jgi:excisionase family DNA binding protein
MDRLLDKKETATILGISVRTLDRLRSTGEIQAVLVRGAVRFHPSAIEKYISKHTSKR